MKNKQYNQVIFSSILLLYTIKYVMVTYIVVIQIFGMNIKFISLSEVKSVLSVVMP